MTFQRSFFRRFRSGKFSGTAPKTSDAPTFEKPNDAPFAPVSARKIDSTDSFDSNDFADFAPPSDFGEEKGERPNFVSKDGRIDWAAALRANEGWLRGTIATRVGEAAAVDEVFQEVALAATRQKAPIQDPRKIGPWLYRLATLQSLLYRRSIGRKKKLLQKYEEALPLVESDARQPNPLQWLLLEERRERVRQATAQLSPDEREILTLKYADDKSYKEISEKTGLTVSAVQSKLFRARARLKEKLTRLLPESEDVARGTRDYTADR